MMSVDMVMGLIRQVLPFLGAMAVTVGWVSTDEANSLVNEGLIVAGALSTIAGTLWSIKANTQASILKSVVDNPKVSKVDVTDNKLKTQVDSRKVKVV